MKQAKLFYRPLSILEMRMNRYDGDNMTEIIFSRTYRELEKGSVDLPWWDNYL